MNRLRRPLSLLLALCLALSLAACGGEAKAASMWLVRTEGKVKVSDDRGDSVDITDRLGLFSGYEVRTRLESYGWIDLDEVKFSKLDQESRVEVNKDGKVLELVLREGAVFFNVTKPLEEDEEMTIRAANMVTAIRGTCGWVRLASEDAPEVYILSGRVEVTTDQGHSIAVSAGQCARLDPEGALTLETFTRSEVPEFVDAEVRADDRLTGFMEALGPDEAAPGASLTDVYFGDAGRSTMTAPEARALAEQLRLLTDSVASRFDAARSRGEVPEGSRAASFAAVFDLGGGRPGLLFSGGALDPAAGDDRALLSLDDDWLDQSVWYFDASGALQRIVNQDGAIISDPVSVYDGYLVTGTGREGDMSRYQGYVLPFEGGRIPHEPSTWVQLGTYDSGVGTMDGYAQSQEDCQAWVEQWDPGSDLGYTHTWEEGQRGQRSWGTYPAETVIAALESWPGGAPTEAPEAPEELPPDPALLTGVWFGDPVACTMTRDQAAQLARTLRDTMAEMDAGFDGAYVSPGQTKTRMGHLARLFDAGNGQPALFYVGGAMYASSYSDREYMQNYFDYRIFHFPGERVEEFTQDSIVAVYDGWVLVGGHAGGDPAYDGAVYELTGSIAAAPSHSAQADWSRDTFTVDGQSASEADFDRWRAAWDPGTELYTESGGDVGAHYSEDGFVSAEDVLAALDAWAGSGSATPEPEAPDPDAVTVEIVTAVPEGFTPTDSITAYYQYPVFHGSAPGVAAVNAVYAAKLQTYMTDVRDFLDAAVAAGHGTYTVDCDARVLGNSLLSVTQSTTNFDPRATSGASWSDSKVYRADTGEEPQLRDLVEGTDQELRDSMIAQFRQDENGSAMDFTDFMRKDINDLEFSLEEGYAVVSVTYAELGIHGGLFGDITVHARLPLRPEFTD